MDESQKESPAESEELVELVDLAQDQLAQLGAIKARLFYKRMFLMAGVTLPVWAVVFYFWVVYLQTKKLPESLPDFSSFPLIGPIIVLFILFCWTVAHEFQQQLEFTRDIASARTRLLRALQDENVRGLLPPDFEWSID
jgi:heme/copper-type cytochrome/quinol oxidase subunit 2